VLLLLLLLLHAAEEDPSAACCRHLHAAAAKRRCAGAADVASSVCESSDMLFLGAQRLEGCRSTALEEGVGYRENLLLHCKDGWRWLSSSSTAKALHAHAVEQRERASSGEHDRCTGCVVNVSATVVAIAAHKRPHSGSITAQRLRSASPQPSQRSSDYSSALNGQHMAHSPLSLA